MYLVIPTRIYYIYMSRKIVSIYCCSLLCWCFLFISPFTLNELRTNRSVCMKVYDIQIFCGYFLNIIEAKTRTLIHNYKSQNEDIQKALTNILRWWFFCLFIAGVYVRRPPVWTQRRWASHNFIIFQIFKP